MNRLLLVLAALAASGPAAAQAAISPNAISPNAISPGYWETVSKSSSPIPASKTERRCIKPQDVAKFMEGKINHIYTCTYPKKVIGDGKIHLEGTCSTRDGPSIPISGQGAFTSDSLHIDAKASIQFGGLSVPIKASTDAKRLGETCPAPDAAPASQSAASEIVG